MKSFSSVLVRAQGWLSALVLCALLNGRAAEADLPKDGAKKSQEARAADELFTSIPFVRLRIEIPESGVQELRKYHWSRQRFYTVKPQARATVHEGVRVYTNVAVQLKGSAGSFQPIDSKPALTLNFDKFAKGQSFHGLDKISLNNSVQDPSYLSEKISREMFAAAGVPVPRAGNALVQLNGANLGLYVLTEGWDKRFLARYFKNLGGNFYDSGFKQDIDGDLEVNSGDNPKNTDALRQLAAAAQMPNAAERWQRLQKILDVDRFIKMVAMETMTGHWDGYTMNQNNYRIFHDLDTGKLVFMPHGMDQMFGNWRRMQPTDSPLFPANTQGMLTYAVLNTEEGRKQYLKTYAELAARVYQSAALVNRVRTLGDQLRPAYAEGGQASYAYSRYGSRSLGDAVNDLSQRIEMRGQAIHAQLEALNNVVRFDDSGVFRLAGWKSRSDYGSPVFDEEKSADGKQLLHINMKSGSGTGTWRARLFLESGRYRLEGRVKTQGVTTDPGDVRGGAGLRPLGQQLMQKVVGNSDWKEIAQEFQVYEALSSVELICELRARTGEAWFDVDSLRLVRRP